MDVFREDSVTEQTDSEFLSAAANWDMELRRQLGASTTGAIVDGLTSKSIRSLKIRLPPLEEQMRFTDFLAAYGRLRGRQEESSRQINEVFQSLLQKAFRGELVAVGLREVHSIKI